METEKIGVLKFRKNLAGYLEGGRPLALTRRATLNYPSMNPRLSAMVTAWVRSLAPSLLRIVFI